MHKGDNKNMNARYSRPPARYHERSKRRSSNYSGHRSKSTDDAQRNYKQYLARAQAEAQSGNTIEAENYYQHAEHYFRTTAWARQTT
jgi:hypothetical protein